MEDKFRSPYLTPQHYDHRVRMRPLIEQQQRQRVSSASAEVALRGQVTVNETQGEEQAPYGD